VILWMYYTSRALPLDRRKYQSYTVKRFFPQQLNPIETFVKKLRVEKDETS
jgi:hypothetical protein